MNRKELNSDILLLITAFIWGFAFVAQKLGMDSLGPFLFNGIRFALGGIVLLPFWIVQKRRSPSIQSGDKSSLKVLPGRAGTKKVLLFGVIAGVLIFCGASLQQVGLQFTTSGKAGFITGLYVILVPIIGILWKQKTGFYTWISAVIAVAGLYFLSITKGFTISNGDLLVLAGSVFWALHVIQISHFVKKAKPLSLAIIQFFICSVLSVIAAIITKESFAGANILQAAGPLLFAGVMSVGVAYTLQVIAQKEAPPAHAAIIMSLEGVFAAIGGLIFLSERNVTPREIMGCVLILAAMIISQKSVFSKKKNKL